MGTVRAVGAGLIAGALVLALVAVLLWQDGTRGAERDQLAEEYRAAIDGDSAQGGDADRVVPLALAGVGAVLFLAGVIVVSRPRTPDA